MIGKLTSSIARTFALALTICATGGASAAVKPLAVWNGDFVDGAERGGFTFELNDNTANADGTITIKTGSGDGAASGGLQFMTNSYVNTSSAPLVAIVGLSNVSMPALGSTSYVLATSKVRYNKTGSESDQINRTGIQLYNKTDGANRFIGYWGGDWNATTDGKYSDATTITSGSHMFAYRYSSGGTYGYLDGTQVYGATDLKSSDDIGVYGFSIGGLTDSADRQLVGAQISSLVILQTSDVNEIKRWNFLKDLTGASDSFADATTTSGVNFSTDETINTAIAPAAVFVQTGSPTLTVQDGGSITIGGGTGMLYVADGASLEIDASAIPLSVSNPTYTILTGAIMGDVSVTALPTVQEGYTVGAYVTDAYVAIALQKSVSITSPFDGTTLASPTMATIRNSDATSVAFGNDRGYWQTVGGNDAIVAKVTGGTYSTALSGFFNQTTVSDASRDVYMVLSDGSGRLVCGVQKCTWVGNGYAGSYETTGDAIVQIEGGTWQYVFGAGTEGAYSSTAIGKVIGSTGVTLTGSGKVSGSVFGGWGSSHARNPTVTQNTAVRVENVQDTDTADDLNYVKKGYIVGGSTYQASDANSCTTVSGNSSVIVDLDSEASGTFVKNIIGGSMLPDAVNYDQTGQIQAVAGNSSVSIVAPAAVTFSGNIIGGGYSGRGSNGGSSTVGGSASVTLTGGTYSGRIVAGGYAPNSGKSTVGTTATLTLNAGTVISSGAILDGGNATGLRTLAVADDFDFSNVTVQNFDIIQVAANKTLTLQAGHEEDAAITLGAGAKLKIVVSSQDVYRYDGHLSYCTLTKGDGATLEYGFKNGSGEYVKIGEEDAINGVSLLPYFQTFKVSNGTAGGNINTASNWGGNAVPTGRNAAFYVNNADGITITIDADITFGDIQVLGSGVVTFTGTGGHKLSCANLDIASGVTVKIGGTSDSEALNVSNGKISGDGSLEILSGAKMVLDGVTSANVIKLAGKLNTKGDTTLSGPNRFDDNSVFTVESGRTELSADQEWVESDIYINSPATLAIGTSWYLGGPTANNYNLIYPYANLVLDVAGTLEMREKRLTFGGGITIKLRDGASITGEGANDSYGNLAWNGDGKLEVSGDATIDATIRTCTNTSPSFDIDAGATLKICKPFIAQNKNSGTAEASDGSITKKGAGTLKLHNVAMTKPISGSEGTVELYSNNSANKIHTATTSFSGALKFVRDTSSNGYHIIGNDTNGSYGSDGNNLYLTGSASFETCGTHPYFILPAYMGGNYLAVANLTGSGTIEPVYGNAVKKTKTIRTKQTRETEFSGVMSGNTDGRNIGLVVYGDDSTVQPLKLTGVNTSYGPLTIDAYGKVIFSGSGSWLNGATTVKEYGVIESQSSTNVAGEVTLESGATVSIVKVGGTLVPFIATTVYLPASGVTVDVSALGLTSASGATAIMACGVNDADYVENLSVTGYVGGGTFSYDSTNSQILFTPTPMGEWTFGSGTWSSSNLTDGATHTITYHENISDVTFEAIPTSPATITLDGTRTPASVTFNGGADTTYVIAGGSFEPVGAVTISSGTVKIDTDATLSEVTGAGTLEIAAGRTVTLTSNTALDGITSLTGTGTLVLPAGAAPSTSGLTTLLSNANWRGTLVVSSITGNVERDFAAWGNSNSNIKMVGVEGKTKTSNVAAERTVAAGVVLDNGDGDFALKFTSILSGNQSTWTKISGSGTIVLEGDDQQVFEIRDSSGFTGSVSQQANAGRLSFVNNKGSGFKSGKGMITVYADNNTEAYIGSGATWTAGNNGIQILGTLVIKGDAILDSVNDSAKITIVNNAKLRYDSLGTLTLSNAVEVVQSLDDYLNTSGIGTVTIAFGDGAILRSGAKLIDWSAAGLSEPPAGTFQISDANSEAKANYVLVKTSSGLFLTSDVASVNGTTYATLQAAIDAAEDSDTVTLIRNSSESVTQNVNQITFVENSGATFTGTFSGTGTLKLPAGALFRSPSDAMWASDWKGTVWISGVQPIIGTGTPSEGQVLFEPNKYGREGSTLKLSGVKGWILAGENHEVTINPDIELADGAYGYGLWLNNGYSYSDNNRYYTDILCLKGDGTLKGSDSASTALLKIADWNDFEGALTLTNKVVVFGTDADLPEPSAINGGGYIIVGEDESVTVPDGKTWTLAKGAIVNGTLTNASGSLVGTGEGLKFYGSGVVTQCVAGAVSHGTEVHGSLSVVFSGADAKFGSSSISMYDTATLTFDPGAGNTNTMNYGLAAATTGNKVIVKSGTLNPTVGNAADSAAFKSAEIVIENGGELLLDTKDTTGWNRCEAPIRVKTGGVLNVAERETMAHDLYLEGGVLRITGAQQNRGLDLFNGRCTIYATSNSTIEATGAYPIYVRDADATINVADGKTLTCNCAFVYHMQGDPTDAYSTNDITKTGTGTLVLNGQSGNSFALPKGLVVDAGTVEVNTTLESNGQTGDAANYYTVASEAKLKVGNSGHIAAATLTLNNDSLLEFGGAGNTSTAFIEVDTAAFDSGTTTVSFSSGVTPTVGAKLISWTGNPDGAFSLAAPLAASYALVSDATGLSIASGVAVVNGTTAYATLQAAIDASGDNDVISLLGNNTESITVALGRTLKIAKGSYTCNVPAPVDGWPTLYSGPDGDGVTTYTTPAAMRTRGETRTYHATFDAAMTDVASGDTVTMRLAISASAVTKSIPSGVTVNLVNSAMSNALFDNVTFTGSGTVELKAFPSDTTSRVDNSWTGTVVFPAAEDVNALDTKLNAWGNNNSKIQLHSVGTTGSKGQGVGTWSPGTVNPTIEILSGATVILNNGNSNTTGIFNTLSGAGTLQLEWTGSYNQQINKLDGFTGTLKRTHNSQKFIIGEIALAAQPSNGDKVVKMDVASVDRIDLTTVPASLTVNGTPVTDMIPDMRLYKKTDGIYASQPLVTVGDVEYFSLDEALAAAGNGQTITLLRDLEYAPAGSVEIGSIDVGTNTLTLTTHAADQVISIASLAGTTGSVIVKSSENPGVGRVAFTGENTGFTGWITVDVGGTLVAESAAPWKASSETSEGMARVTVNGTLVLTHDAYVGGIVLKQVTWGEASRLELVDSVHADGSITVSNDYASGEPVTWDVVDVYYRVIGGDVTKTSDAVSKTDTYTYKPHVSGSACLLDFTFTNTVRVVSGTNRIFAASTSQLQDDRKYSLKTDWDGDNSVTEFLAPGTGKTNNEMWPVYTNNIGTVEEPLYTALHALIRPFRGTDDDDDGNVEAHAVYFLPNDRPCSAFVAGTIPSAPHTCFVSFGSTQGGIFLATGDTPDEVDLIYVKSTDVPYDAKVHFRREHCTKLTTMRVPYGDAAQHTVVFETSDHQTYDIYLDGELWTRYSFPARIEIQHGFHIGSWIGGDNEAERFYRKIAVDTAPNSYISAIRIYDTALGPNAIAALAEEFPYVSPGLGYERILTTSETTESWSQANAWRNVAESEEFAETLPADMSSLVAITNNSSVEKTIEVNLDRTQKIESLTVSGAQPVRFEKGTGLVAIYGKVTINTDVYNEYGALDMFGVPLEIAAGKHLTLDLTNMPIDDYYEVTHIRISGYSTEPANPEATTPGEKEGWPLVPLFPQTKRYDFDVEYNMTDHSYYLVLYPNHTHVDDVQGNPSGFISVHDTAEAVLTQLTGRDYVLPATVDKVSVEYGKYDITKVFDGGDVGGQFFITNIVDGKVHPTLNPEASIVIDGQTISVSPVVAAVRIDGNDVAAMADGDNESVVFGVKTIPGLWYAVSSSENGKDFTVDYDSVQQATGTALMLESDELHNSQKIRYFKISASESKAEFGTAKTVDTVLSYVNDTDYQGLNAHGMDIDEGAVAGFGPVVYGLKVAGSEDGDFFDDTFRSLTFNLNGTATDGKVYALKNADGFTVATATSASGSVTFSLGPNAIANGTLYLVAPETMLETVGVASYKWNGQETATSVDQIAQIPLVMLANTPAKDGLKSVNTVLDANSAIDTSNRNVGSVYRIPAIANNGTNIVAMFDCRYLNHNDLGTTWAGELRAIDQAVCESADSGLSWTSPTIAIDVPNYNNGSSGVALRECDFGDPCLGFFNHKFYVMAQTGVGLQGSNTNDNDLVMYSRDEEVGSAWGNRTSVQAAIMSALETARGGDPAYPATRGILQGPGHAIVSNSELHFPMQYFPLTGSGNNPRVFVASLASDGTWTATKLTAGTEDAEEPSLVVLDNGDWYMIAKDGASGATGRHVFVSKDQVSWTKVKKQFVGETPPVQGSMLKVGTKNDNGVDHGVYVAAMDTGSWAGGGTDDGRRDLKLFIGTDASSSDANRTYDVSSEPITWTSKADAIMIYDGYTEGQGYNSIVQIDATTIGVLFEAAKHIYFKKIDISSYVD